MTNKVNDIEQEWKNGDICIFGSSDMSGVYITYDKYNSGHVIYSCGEYFYVLDGDFQKPEKPEQKAERERLEEQEEARKEALSMLDEVADMKSANVNIDCTYAIAVTVRSMIELGYRKQ